MGCLQRAIRSVWRKKVKTLLFLVMIIVIACFEFAVSASKNAQIVVQDASQAAAQRSFRLELNSNDYTQRLMDVPVIQLPNGATLSKMPDNQFGSVLQNDIERLSEVDGIQSYNITTAGFAVNPCNFKRIEDEENDQHNDQRAVMLRGNLRIDRDKEILSGKIKLKEGRLGGGGDENVCVISEEIAQKNQLQIGDRLKFNDYRDRKNSKIYTAEVIGIYLGAASIEPAMPGDTYRGENLILTDLDFPEKASGSPGDPLYQYATFFSDPKKDYDLVKENIKKEDINWKRYDLIDDSGSIEQISENFGKISEISNVLFMICMIAGVVILFLNFVFWVRQRQNEIGILISLGKSKFEIVGQFFVEAVLIAGIAFSVSIFLSPVIAEKMMNYIVMEQDADMKENNSVVSAQSEGPAGIDEANENVQAIDMKITTAMFVKNFILIISMIAGAILLVSFSIMKKRPKEILYAR